MKSVVRPLSYRTRCRDAKQTKTRFLLRIVKAHRAGPLPQGERLHDVDYSRSDAVLGGTVTFVKPPGPCSETVRGQKRAVFSLALRDGDAMRLLWAARRRHEGGEKTSSPTEGLVPWTHPETSIRFHEQRAQLCGDDQSALSPAPHPTRSVFSSPQRRRWPCPARPVCRGRAKRSIAQKKTRKGMHA